MKACMARIVTAAALALALVLCGDVWAGPPTDALHDMFAAVNRLLDDPELREKPTELLAAIRNVVSDSLDFRVAARLALGREWQARTLKEQDAFVRLFADLLKQAYFSGIASRARVQGGLAIRYGAEAIDGHRATVVTTILGRDGGEIPLEYRMIQDHERWAVYDVVIDGVSLAANYRAQFARVIEQSSYGELVAQMKAKTSEAPSGPIAAGQGDIGAGPAATARHWDLDLDRDSLVNSGAPRTATAAIESPAPGRPAPVSVPSYWIQMGVFKNPETAIGLAARLLEQNLPVSIDSVAVPAGQRGTLLSRVRVGPFLDHAEAAAKLRSLRTNNYRPFIAREPR